MSQTSDDSEVAAELQFNLVQNFMIFSMTALAAYEYLITINQEVTMVWRRTWTATTWMFIANRYLMVGLVMYTVFPYTAQSCGPGSVLGDIMQAAQYGIYGAFSALRVFAICDRNITLAIIVLILNLVPVGTNIYDFSRETDLFYVDPILGAICTFNLDVSGTVNFHMVLGTRTSLIAADILVVVFTWHKTFMVRRQAARIGLQTPVYSLILRDGTAYFIALLIMNIAQILVYTVQTLPDIPTVTIIIQVLQPILISRFLLNLRRVGGSNDDTRNISSSRFSTLGFRTPTWASIVGNMGEDLSYGAEEDAFDSDVTDSDVIEMADIPDPLASG